MSEFNLTESLNSVAPEDVLNFPTNTTNYYMTESVKLNELDSSIYELGKPTGLYASSGLKDPNLLSKNEQQDILESIFQGIDENTFNRINQITGKFMHLHGQGLLGTLGGVIDLIIGVLDVLGLTDDLIGGILGFAGGGGSALEAGVGAVLGQVFGNGRVNSAIKKGAERSNKFAEAASQKATQVQEAESSVLLRGDGNKKELISGSHSVAAARTTHKSFYSHTTEAPLMSFASDTMLSNSKAFKQVSDLFSLQSQHADYTIDDTYTLNANVMASTANNYRLVSRELVNNSERHEIIASKNLHIQAGSAGGSPFAIGDEIVETPTNLSISSTEDTFNYTGRDHYLFSKNVLALDSKFLFINMGAAVPAAVLALPRNVVKVTPLPNPEGVEIKNNSNPDTITIAEGNPIPASRMNTNTATTQTNDMIIS